MVIYSTFVSRRVVFIKHNYGASIHYMELIEPVLIMTVPAKVLYYYKSNLHLYIYQKYTDRYIIEHIIFMRGQSRPIYNGLGKAAYKR